MKNSSKTILVTGMLLFALTTKANIVGESTITNQMEKTIKSSVKLPEGASENQKVEVLFTTDAFGKVNFVLAKTSDTELKKSVEQQFFNLSFQNLQHDVVNSVTLNFRTIK
jgi:hypothetical protein